MLIGDQALKFLLEPHEHEIWDLGAAWLELTQLPFVYAVWALRRASRTNACAANCGKPRISGWIPWTHIIDSRTDYDRDFRKDYLGWHIHYHLARMKNAEWPTLSNY